MKLDGNGGAIYERQVDTFVAKPVVKNAEDAEKNQRCDHQSDDEIGKANSLAGENRIL
ncbi:MAG: hypothetical protein ACREXW_02270 [Gammaproteobacteria bacterium]